MYFSDDNPYCLPNGCTRKTNSKPLPKYQDGYPKRLKLEGTELGDSFNELAIITLGETIWYQMKNGGFYASKLEDDEFIMAQFLNKQLETYDPDAIVETVETVETVKITNTSINTSSNTNIVEEKVHPVQKQKKKRDRRIKTRDRVFTKETI
jgi:hypothetical protein